MFYILDRLCLCRLHTEYQAKRDGTPNEQVPLRKILVPEEILLVLLISLLFPLFYLMFSLICCNFSTRPALFPLLHLLFPLFYLLLPFDSYPFSVVISMQAHRVQVPILAARCLTIRQLTCVSKKNSARLRFKNYCLTLTSHFKL